ncbi:Alpha/Beta hydrolase protein [Tribonema minus]|uniref:Alpha/Beta hydrolase protein n=1 Tax=Tribonema minus TaxID=303371 RepID=A0A835ZJ96_9STRA|nr:Alpha/Beta hydrolase protein [Tribonema minus]
MHAQQEPIALKIPLPDRGYDLAALLDLKNAKSKDIVVVCHGLISDKRRSVAATLAEALQQRNLCRFDFAGNGDSGGEWTLSGYDREMEDLRGVVQHLRGEGWAVTAVVGHSKGACAVIKYAAKYDDVPLVVPVAGRFDMSQTPASRYTEEQWRQLREEGATQWVVGGRSYTVRQADLDEKAALDMAAECAAIHKSKVHIIHGDADDTIPVRDAHEFHKHLPDSTLTIIEGGSHSFRTSAEGREHMAAAVERCLGVQHDAVAA